MKIRFRKMYADAVVPRYQRDGDAGMDLSAYGSCMLQPGESVAIDTGIAIEIPPGFEGQIRPRSGLNKRGIDCRLGTIDSNFRGSMAVILVNNSRKVFVADHGDRIAQLVIAPVVTAELEEADVLSETERGEAGFGSSGVSA